MSHNTIDYSKNILSEIGQVVKGVILASIQFVAQLTIIGLLALLIFVDGGSPDRRRLAWRDFLGIYLVARPFISLASERRVSARRYLVVDEAFRDQGGQGRRARADLPDAFIGRPGNMPTTRRPPRHSRRCRIHSETISFGGILGLCSF